ncbi:hypothetical protein BC829DRAFT_383120 [Chytridium lagenaria]|nr:hypothetical protein BC829DRAFT_383120 [Chytridium lagenaria]
MILNLQLLLFLLFAIRTPFQVPLALEHLLECLLEECRLLGKLLEANSLECRHGECHLQDCHRLVCLDYPLEELLLIK